jgi:hypothetical protein
MTDQTKTRTMSPKGFLNRANAAKSAIGFIQAHREYMLSGELAPVLAPILAKVDAKELMPTPALNEVATATMNHIIALSLKEIAEAASGEKPTRQGTSKNWTATIYDSTGKVCTRINTKGEEEDLIKGYDLSEDGRRWIDRRLFDGASDWYGELVHSHSSCKETVFRQDAVARMLAKKRGPSVHVSARSTGKLSFGAHCKQKRVSFSHG